MPTYEFRCSQPKCGYQFTDMQPMDLPPPQCPKCKQPTQKVPCFRGSVIGITPKFYPNRG